MKAYDVIIVNFNGEKIIGPCLDSVYASSIKPSNVIIYDNSSSDGSIKLIKKNYPDVILIEGEKNIGFGPANNAASKCARSDYLLFMNNDLLLDQKCAEKLIEGFTDPNVVIQNSLTYKGWEKKPNQELYSFGAKVDKYGFGYGLYSTEEEIDDLNSFSAACFMMRNDAFKKFPFEKSFFLYYEEPELSVKLLKAGLKISRVKDAICYHLESYSSPNKNLDGVAFRQYFGAQNRWFMLGKHWPLHMLPAALMVNIAHLFYIIFFYIKNGKTKYLKLFYEAPKKFFEGLKYRKIAKINDPIWYKRLSGITFQSYLKLGQKVFNKSN